MKEDRIPKKVLNMKLQSKNACEEEDRARDIRDRLKMMSHRTKEEHGRKMRRETLGKRQIDGVLVAGRPTEGATTKEGKD
jgi:hypothetical protein